MAAFDPASPRERLRSLAILREMQRRLEDGPLAALGVSAAAAPQEIRQAFLGLTKQFHPAKFARLDEGTVRLANEVFLALRDAYDELRGAAPSAPRRLGTDPGIADPREARRPAIATALRPASGDATRPAAAIPAAPQQAPTSSATRPAAATSASVATRPPAATSAATRPAAATSASVATRPPAATSAATRPPVATSTSAATRPPVATSTSAATRPPAAGAHDMTSPASSSQREASASAARPAATRQPSTVAPPQVRFSTPPTAATPVPRVAAPAGLLSLLQAKSWAKAKAMLQEKVTAEPNAPRHLAWLAYARACEAFDAGNAREARRELIRALAIEPALQEAAALLTALNQGAGGATGSR